MSGAAPWHHRCHETVHTPPFAVCMHNTPPNGYTGPHVCQHHTLTSSLAARLGAAAPRSAASSNAPAKNRLTNRRRLCSVTGCALS